MARCVKCKGETRKIKANFKGHKIDAYKCKKCGEEYFEPKQAQKILEENKHKFSRKKPVRIAGTYVSTLQVLMDALDEMTKTMGRTVCVLENLDARLKALEVEYGRRSK